MGALFVCLGDCVVFGGNGGRLLFDGLGDYALFGGMGRKNGICGSVPATVCYLGENRELIEELLNDPALASCAFRAEGRMLVVLDKHRKKFIDLLTEHGVAHF